MKSKVLERSADANKKIVASGMAIAGRNRNYLIMGFML
jgi:hypothetical protein